MSLNQIFKGVFETTSTSNLSIMNFMLCIGISLVIGFVISYAYMYKSKYTKSFIVTLATLPAVVCMVIMMVNGNLGAGVAVAGTFSLVRFRSVPGTAKEIGAIFLAMGTGLATGMGYVVFGIIFAMIICIIWLVYTKSNIGEKSITEKVLKVTIPEDLDYTGVFDDLFEKYTTSHDLVQVKTVNMGSLFKLTYDIKLKNIEEEKVFIDDIRCRNGNLEISLLKQSPSVAEL